MFRAGMNPGMRNMGMGMEGLGGGLSPAILRSSSLPNSTGPFNPSNAGPIRKQPGFFGKLGQRFSDPQFLQAIGQKFGPKPQPMQRPQFNTQPFSMKRSFGMGTRMGQRGMGPVNRAY